ncbi:MAG: adenine deaminase [Proteobacteria bacterium]|nr:adenine deaminase [Pseudomonadota bacterium]
MKVSGNIVDVLNSTIYPGTILINDGRIVDIVRDSRRYNTFIVPGFIDAHVHIESSMLVPSEFARLAVVHGTIATVSDPHEIANVLGIEGVRFMVENGKTVPFNFFFGASPCVPATSFETSGASLDVPEIDALLRREDIKYLSEMMNFPGVINEDSDVMEKVAIAKRYGKPIDGHAPGLRGETLEKYVRAGISTDHETFQYEEGLEKLSLGMKLIVREGSAAKNFDVLSPLILKYSDQCMLCSDDKHPDDLITGHINELVKRALRMEIDVMTVLKCACVNPVIHYGLDTGLLRSGDYADFIEVDNLERFDILRTYINGEVVAEHGKTLLPHLPAPLLNNFSATEKKVSDFFVSRKGDTINAIEVVNNQVITGRVAMTCRPSENNVISDTERDLLKLAVVNRYENRPPAIGFVKNFGLKRGAIASSVAHDSHNIVAVGVTDEDICNAVNLIIQHKGGLSVVYDDVREILPLPVAGLMSNEDGYSIAQHYAKLDHLAKQLGSFLSAPFMTLSFVALLVIPKLKLSDRGLFDGEQFQFTGLFTDK